MHAENAVARVVHVPSALAPACALGVALQVVLLLAWDPGRPTAAALLITALVGAPLWLGRTRWPRAAGAAAASGALGGLGMLAGTLLDQRWGTQVLPPCHARLAPLTFSSLLTWMNGLMLLTCVPACLWLTPSCSTSAAGLWRHVLCVVPMFFGMVLGGRWLAPPLDGMLSALAANHVGMLIGMTLGAAAAHALPGRSPDHHREVPLAIAARIARTRSGRVRAVPARPRS